jgi:hypothetical protein
VSTHLAHPCPSVLLLLSNPLQLSALDLSHMSLQAANLVNGRYTYLHDLNQLELCTAPDGPVRWPTCPSPIRLDNWVEFLRSHPDHFFASYIFNGLLSEFHIGHERQNSTLRSAPRNHPSAAANATVISGYIRGELEAGRLVGPVTRSVAPLIHSSPLGLVPKSHQSNRWRTIMDLSAPRGHSVNDGISRELSSMSYARGQSTTYYSAAGELSSLKLT